MAMNASTLAEAIKPDLKSTIISNLATLKAKYENIDDDNRLTGYDQSTYQNDYFEALVNAIADVVSDKIVAHIQGTAEAIGADSHGDSHDLTIV